MKEKIELIISVKSERVIRQKLLKEAAQNFIKKGKNELSFLEEKSLLTCCLGKAVEKKEEVESFYIII